MHQIPDSYSITAARPADITALIAVDKAASTLFAPTGLLSPEALKAHVPASVFEQEIPHENVRVARDETGWPVGFVLVRQRVRGLYLDQVSVHPDHGRQGLGRALVMTALDMAARRNLAHVTLSTFRDLPWNGPFYRALGFRELSRKQYDPYMLDIEDAQSQIMDISQRCFMRCKIHRPLFRFGPRKKETQR